MFTMWGIWLKKLLPAVLLLIITILSIIIAIAVTLRSCNSSPEPETDYFKEARQQILDTVARERSENEAKLKLLEAELYELRVQMDDLDAEIEKSVEVRDEIHDAIDHAKSIDDIDRVLRGAIPGVGGRRD